MVLAIALAFTLSKSQKKKLCPLLNMASCGFFFLQQDECVGWNNLFLQQLQPKTPQSSLTNHQPIGGKSGKLFISQYLLCLCVCVCLDWELIFLKGEKKKNVKLLDKEECLFENFLCFRFFFL